MPLLAAIGIANLRLDDDSGAPPQRTSPVEPSYSYEYKIKVDSQDDDDGSESSGGLDDGGGQCEGGLARMRGPMICRSGVFPAVWAATFRSEPPAG